MCCKLHATCYMLHATCYMLHADHFSPCPVNMQMVDVLNAICYMLHAKCYMLKTKSWSDLLILTSSSQHADGRCVARPRTSLGLVSHQPPCWQHSFRLFTQLKKHRPELVLSLFCSYNWENTKMTRQTDYLPGLRITLDGHLPSTSSFMTTEGGNLVKLVRSRWNLRSISEFYFKKMEFLSWCCDLCYPIHFPTVQACHVLCFSPPSCDHFCNEIGNPDLPHLEHD